MRKCSIFIFVLIALFSTIETKAQMYKIGAVGGINFAYLDELAVEYNQRTAIGLGGAFEYDINKNVAISVQPMYLQKGAKFSEADPLDASASKLDVELKLSYIEIPIFFKIPLAINPARYYVLAGPTLGIAIGSQKALKGNSMDVSINIEETIKSADFGLMFGCGAKLPIGTNTIFAEARYTVGQKDIEQSGSVYLWKEKVDIADGKVKTRGLQFMVGILVPIGKQLYF